MAIATAINNWGINRKLSFLCSNTLGKLSFQKNDEGLEAMLAWQRQMTMIIILPPPGLHLKVSM
jgi:hypothetical protein